MSKIWWAFKFDKIGIFTRFLHPSLLFRFVSFLCLKCIFWNIRSTIFQFQNFNNIFILLLYHSKRSTGKLWTFFGFKWNLLEMFFDILVSNYGKIYLIQCLLVKISILNCENWYEMAKCVEKWCKITYIQNFIITWWCNNLFDFPVYNKNKIHHRNSLNVCSIISGTYLSCALYLRGTIDTISLVNLVQEKP